MVLVSLSSSSLAEEGEADSSNLGTISAVHRSQSSHAIGHNQYLNLDQSVHNKSNEDTKEFAASDSKNSLSQLLGYDTVTSAEDLSGLSSYTKSNIEQGHKNVTDIPEDVTGVKSTLSSKCPSRSDNFDDPFICSSSSSSLLMVSRDTKPSPWKLIGQCRQNEIAADEIGDDSVSIEVDSIEDDEPPCEFKVETTCQGEDLTMEVDNGRHDCITKLEQEDDHCLGKEHLLADNDHCSCYYEKVYEPDSLVLLLKFRTMDDVTDNVSGCLSRMGSMLIEESCYDITVQVSSLCVCVHMEFSFV